MQRNISDVINESIVRYLGYGDSPYPKEDMSRAISGLDDDLAKSVSQKIEEIMRYANTLRPDWNTHDLFSGSNWIAEKTSEKYPVVGEKGTKAISWAFSYWWK